MKTRTYFIGGVGGAMVILSAIFFSYIATQLLGCSDMSVGSPAPPYETKTDESGIDAIDRILKNLEFGNVAFNAPKMMNISETAVIHLVLSLETPIDNLKQMVEGTGAKESASIQVSDRMEARLSGPDFAITAITPETQAVSRSNFTEWKWEVKPIGEGRHYLHLTLSAILRVDGESTPRAIRTFDKMIEVEVTWHQRVGSFFKNNWQWLWAAILIPVGGWLWKRRKKAS